MRWPSLILTASVLLATPLVGCDDDAASSPTTPPTEIPSGKGDSARITINWKPRIDTMWLHIDVAERRGEASIWFEDDTAAKGSTVSLEAGGLVIDEVWDDDGPLPFEHRAGALHIAHSPSKGPVHIDYRFDVEQQGEGFAKNGSTVIWPYFCGNLFPCRSKPDDGITFELTVGGFGDGELAIYPDELTADAPAYTLAFAVGKYTCQDLGKTDFGTKVSVCWLPRGKTKALAGSRPLVKAFEWLETTYGPYNFGKHVASVATNWGESSAGGMEHHPFWHIATGEMGDPVTHVHEAVHGWFGTGIRIACWEDFVLSEGTTSYVTARALGAVTDPETEDAVWESYRETLEYTLEDEDIIAWPTGCNKVDILRDGLFSNIVYMKGAFFWKEVADNVGPEVLDAVFARFYEERFGTPARMQELVDAVRTDTGFDPGPLVQRWLRSKGNPFE